jgi:hypothetical protein
MNGTHERTSRFREVNVMKRFPRFLQRLSLVMLGAIVWSGSSDAGAGMDNASATQKKLPPGSPEIQSFIATPSRVLKGDAAVLRWVVAHAEHIWISREERLDSADCVKEASGEMRVTPETETTYKLHAWAGAVHVLRQVTVQVSEPSGSCTISGQITNDKKEYATTVGLFRFESATPQLSKAVDRAGRFEFSGVPEGIYRVIPKGKYPAGKLAIGPVPRVRRVSCEPNGVHRVEDFKIASNEG